MVKTSERDNLAIQQAALIKELIKAAGPGATMEPDFPAVLMRMVNERLGIDGSTVATASDKPGADLADLVGLDDDAPPTLGQVATAEGIGDYDDRVAADRILAAADLYYIYVHEWLGVFRVLDKLQELFRAGTLRISADKGAFGLYRFDRQNILRYRLPDRARAYRRVFGYTRSDAGPNARPNPQFHGLFVHFVGEVAKFWRDKRIAEVIRERATDPTFGSIAIVRRAGLDLRNNLKNVSYGYINVLRIETLQALSQAFEVLEAPDIRAQFGAENAWEVIELVMWQYFGRTVHASTMNRMAVSGRKMLQWLGQPYILETDRSTFETFLYPIAEPAEEWISSEAGMRMSAPTPPARNVYQQGPPPAGGRRDPVISRTALPAREFTEF